MPTAQRYAFLRLDAERRRAEPEEADSAVEEGDAEAAEAEAGAVATSISEEQYLDLAATRCDSCG